MLGSLVCSSALCEVSLAKLIKYMSPECVHTYVGMYEYANWP